ncbi:MAG: prepilin-type N-terminal cleavage/methylation domain-containing protein [Deltaproteobacteria bacterium]|nr:prepilin-type N-terminal cleavage/methylation domain-containing protein [Deltaproteobacteria bacterium]
MSSDDHRNSSIRGFTLTELVITLSIFGILCSIAVPAFSSWLPEYRLKSAARDLYSNMQLARMMSLKNSGNYRVIFNAGENGAYSIVSPDGTIERSISFLDYDKGGGIGFGGGKAMINATTSGGELPDDGVSYQYNKMSFTPRGLGSGMGYAYIENNKGTAYAVGTAGITGIIVMKKWNDSTGEWE